MPLLDKDGLTRVWAKCKAAFATASHTHSAATTSTAGFMSAADKTKLNGLVSGGTPVYHYSTLPGNAEVPTLPCVVVDTSSMQAYWYD